MVQKLDYELAQSASILINDLAWSKKAKSS